MWLFVKRSLLMPVFDINQVIGIKKTRVHTPLYSLSSADIKLIGNIVIVVYSNTSISY